MQLIAASQRNTAQLHHWFALVEVRTERERRLAEKRYLEDGWHGRLDGSDHRLESAGRLAMCAAGRTRSRN